MLFVTNNFCGKTWKGYNTINRNHFYGSIYPDLSDCTNLKFCKLLVSIFSSFNLSNILKMKSSCQNNVIILYYFCRYCKKRCFSSGKMEKISNL